MIIDVLMNVNCKNIGLNMMDGFKKIQNPDMVNWFLLMVKNMLGSLSLIWFMVKVNSIVKMVKL